MQAVERHEQRRLGLELDLEALLAELPTVGEMAVVHHPVGAHGDDRLAADRALPGEPLRGDGARLDHADRRVDRPGRERHLVLRALLGIEREPELVRNHVDRLEKPVGHDLEHRALRGHFGRLAEQHHVTDHARRRVVADVGELLHAHVADVAAEAR